MIGALRGDGERAVSDVLAFIIVFSIIITSVALVYGTGFSSIKQVAEGEQKANAERAFEAVALSMDDIVEGQAPRRGGSLNLGGGQLQVDDSTKIKVEAGGSFSTTQTVGSFEYYVDDTAVAYEAGGVFRRDGTASVTVRQPTMKCSSDAAVISIVKVTSPDNPIGATDNVELTMVEQDTQLLYSQSSSATVEVTVSDSDYQAAWERMLVERADSTWSDAGSATASCSTDRVVVRLVVVEITYDVP